MSDVPLTWASHPNADLRLRLADLMSHGWTIDELTLDAAVVSRAKSAAPIWALLNPLFFILKAADRRRDHIRLIASPSGDIVQQPW